MRHSVFKGTCKICGTDFEYCVQTRGRLRHYCGSECQRKGKNANNRKYIKKGRAFLPVYIYVCVCKTCNTEFQFCNVRSISASRRYCSSLCRKGPPKPEPKRWNDKGSEKDHIETLRKIQTRGRSYEGHIDFDGTMTPEKRLEIRTAIDKLKRKKLPNATDLRFRSSN